MMGTAQIGQSQSPACFHGDLQPYNIFCRRKSFPLARLQSALAADSAVPQNKESCSAHNDAGSKVRSTGLLCRIVRSGSQMVAL